MTQTRDPESLGREVRLLARGEWLEAGPERLEWDGRDSRGTPAGGGEYFVRPRTAGGSGTRSVIKLR